MPHNGPNQRNPHAPAHWFVHGATYMVTAATHGRARLMRSPAKRDHVLEAILNEYRTFGWSLMAWSLAENHYHLVATAPGECAHVGDLTRRIHSRTAIWLNKEDHTPGRRVWYQYWDTCLTNPKSTDARLNYVHHNPVRHGLARDAADYRWCSMRWLLETANAADRERILDAPIDRVRVHDDF